MIAAVLLLPDRVNVPWHCGQVTPLIIVLVDECSMFKSGIVNAILYRSKTGLSAKVPLILFQGRKRIKLWRRVLTYGKSGKDRTGIVRMVTSRKNIETN